jgi:Reverse transcriptase (RNA-dependent DNA polymerase)
MASSKQWSAPRKRLSTDPVQFVPVQHTRNIIQYADDIALTYQAQSFAECETSLEADLERLSSYFGRWRLQPNPSKTEACVFHLSNHDANRTLKINFDGTQVQHVENPKYLGVSMGMDRFLTYNAHLTNPKR